MVLDGEGQVLRGRWTDSDGVEEGLGGLYATEDTGVVAEHHEGLF